MSRYTHVVTQNKKGSYFNPSVHDVQYTSVNYIDTFRKNCKFTTNKAQFLFEKHTHKVKCSEAEEPLRVISCSHSDGL